MKPVEDWVTLALLASVLWVRDTNRVVVIQPGAQKTLALHGLEAAIWGWLTLAYPYPRLVELVKFSLDESEDVAEKRLLETLRSWTAAGFLVVVGEPG